MDSARDINIVSGDCHVFPLTWTVKVPESNQMLLSVHNVSFTCPGLQLNIRDGVDNIDTLLYTIHEDTNVSVSVRTSTHVSRLELVSDTRNMNSSTCYAVMHISVLTRGNYLFYSLERVRSIYVGSEWVSWQSEEIYFSSR